MRHAIAVLAVSVLPVVAWAQSESDIKALGLMKAEVAQQEVEKAKRDFAGISFGVAIGVTIPIFANRRIEEAVMVPNGDEMVVRATKRKNSSARIMLETHYFFAFGDDDMRGFGPMIVIQPGTEEIVEGAGLGVMLGFRRSKKTSDSFNIGAGVFMEPSIKDLGEGVEEDKPLPAGETEVRFQEKSAVSLLVIGSFAF